MRARGPWGIAAFVWFVSILTLAGAASGLLAAAQSRVPTDPSGARILSGSDVGFRVEGKDPRTGLPTGTWVVRLDGRWTAVGTTPSVVPVR